MVLIIILFPLVALICILVQPDFRQGWRNTKFLDELKQERKKNQESGNSETDPYDLMKPDY
jgi:hypothetical protein